MKQSRKPKGDRGVEAVYLPAPEVRQALEISERAMSRLLASLRGVVRSGGGRRPRVPVVPLLKHLGERLKAKAEPPDEEATRELTRWRRARADAAERENRVAEAELVPASEVRQIFRTIGNMLQSEFRVIDAKYGEGVAKEIAMAMARAERVFNEQIGAMKAPQESNEEKGD